MISPVKIWRRQKDIKQILGKKGKIISWTKLFVVGQDFKRYAPYPVVLVELENKKRVVGQLVDYKEEELRFNQEVIGILRKVRQPTPESVIPYGIKFKPIRK